jgi:hypothetical protein
MLCLLQMRNIVFVFANYYPFFIFTSVKHNLCLQPLRFSLILGTCRVSLGMRNFSLGMLSPSGTPWGQTTHKGVL